MASTADLGRLYRELMARPEARALADGYHYSYPQDDQILGLIRDLALDHGADEALASRLVELISIPF